MANGEADFRQVTESLPQLVWTCRADGLCDYLSRQWIEYTGRTEAEQLGYGWLEQLHPEDRERTSRAWQATAARGDRFAVEFRIRRYDGVYRWFRTLAVPLQDASGVVVKWFGSNTDIQDLKEIEAALRQSETRFRKIFEHAAIGIAITDMEGRFQQCNPAYCALLGYSEDELRGLEFAERIHPEDLADNLAAVDRLRNQQLPFFEIENRYIHKDGRPVWVRKFVSVLPDAAGIPAHLVALVTDMTERRKAERELEAYATFTRAVLDSLDAHICVVDQEGDIVRTNRAWEDFARHGSPPQGAMHAGVGVNYLEQCRRAMSEGDATAQSVFDGLREVLAGRRQSFVAEYPCHSPEEKRWFMMRVTPLQGSSGAVVSHVNITDQVEMRQVLKEQAATLEANRDQLEDLSAKLIKAQEEERRRIARELHDDLSQRVASLILDIGALEQHPERLERAAHELEPLRVQLEGLADDLHRLAYTLHPSLLQHAGLQAAIEDHIHRVAQRTGLRILLKAQGLPDTISLDRSTCLFRVLQESLQNIIKHADATEVSVKLSGAPKGVGLSVTDNGKGFDPLEQNALRTGLGLISMQERLRSVQGFLRVHSRPVGGTKVCAWIPAQGEPS